MLWSLAKILTFVVLVAALAFGAGLLNDATLNFRLAFGGLELTLGPLQAVVLALVSIAVLWVLFKVAGFIIALVRFLLGEETAISRYFDRNHERKGYQALADGFNSAVQSLDDLVAEVLYHSEQMGGEIRDISSATNDLAHRTESQAANLQITSEELDELTQSVLLNAKNVDQANGNSSQAKSSAQTSGVVVSQASTAMSAIKTEAEEIAKIVTLIEGISFQTNLLALNAGVEAARAGDAGRGFAVVASEVRALAKRSSESVVSIRALIERSTGQVNDGSKKISDTVSSLEAVEVAIVDITSKMGEISSSTQEQSKRITTINKSISEMGGVTQRNAAMFEETNAACTNLANGADELQQLTRRFKISENGRVGLAAA